MAVVDKLKELSKLTLPVRETSVVKQPVATATPAATATAGTSLTAEQLIAELTRQKRSAA
jgi:hypothetical protein